MTEEQPLDKATGVLGGEAEVVENGVMKKQIEENVKRSQESVKEGKEPKNDKGRAMIEKEEGKNVSLEGEKDINKEVEKTDSKEKRIVKKENNKPEGKECQGSHVGDDKDNDKGRRGSDGSGFNNDGKGRRGSDGSDSKDNGKERQGSDGSSGENSPKGRRGSDGSSGENSAKGRRGSSHSDGKYFDKEKRVSDLSKGTSDVVDESDGDYRDEADGKERELDDDEIAENPAYVPRCGRFYMHDSRNTDEVKPVETFRSRADGQWKHDRFDERYQRPKTKRELVNKYGFDIREKPMSDEAKTSARANQEEKRENKSSHRAKDNTEEQNKNTQKTAPRGRGGFRGMNRQQANHRNSQAPAFSQRAERNDGSFSGGGGGSRVVRSTSYSSGSQKSSGREDHERSSFGRTGEQFDNNRDGTAGVRGSGATRDHEAVVNTHVEPPVRGGHTGGKRYSTQRVASTFVEQQPQQIQQPRIPQDPIIRPEWHPAPNFVPQPRIPAIPPQGMGPPPIAMQAPPPAAAAYRAPNDIVYFDPHQQMIRNTVPPQPRAKKRLEIVPPTQANATK